MFSPWFLVQVKLIHFFWFGVYVGRCIPTGNCFVDLTRHETKGEIILLILMYPGESFSITFLINVKDLTVPELCHGPYVISEGIRTIVNSK